MSLYPEKVWRLFREPRRAGRFDPGQNARRGRATTPAGHAMLQIELVQADDGRVDDALFQALGCPWLIATGAWLCAHVIGRKGEALRALEPRAVTEQLELPAVKRYCAVMAVEALNQALDAPADDAAVSSTANEKCEP